MSRKLTIVCLSPQDWDTELPTNRQQIMRRAAGFGHSIVFVETSQSISRDLFQVLRFDHGNLTHLARKLTTGQSVAPGITVRRAPWLLPWGRRFRWANRLNVALTRRMVRAVARRSPGPFILWLYDAASSDLVGRCGEAVALYDCVDDHAEVAGSDQRVRALLSAGDRNAASASTVVVTTTRRLYERHARSNPSTFLIPNVGDYDHFSPAAYRDIVAPELATLPRPVLGFIGNVTAWKVDFELLEGIATNRPEWSLVLVGPCRPDASEQLARLGRLANVYYLGPRPYAQLPAFVAGFDVGLCPYLWNEAMQSGFPLKLYEYLAAGKPVVASGNPDLAGMEPDVRLVRGVWESIRAIEDVLASADDETALKRRMALAAANTWESRASRMLDLVEERLSA